MTTLIWRDAHAWMRGYSDAEAGKDALALNPFGLEHQSAYERGFAFYHTDRLVRAA